MTRPIIGIAGRKYSGKTTAAQYMLTYAMQNDFEAESYHFAQPLKLMLEQVFGFPFPESEEGKNTKVPGFEFTWREAAQLVGTECFRDMLDQDIWVKLLERQLVAHPWDLAIVGDVRFMNEIDMIMRLGGKVYYIDRPQLEQDDDHKSESAIQATDCDMTIVNGGELSELRLMCNWIAKENLKDVRATD